MCPKVAGYPGQEADLFEDPHSCDPAGAVFRETLDDLNEVDRLLLLFCSTANLAAVRWLFVLGASPDTCDTNGTTCLHTACRSGSLAIVRDLIARGLPLDSADVTGWTALHIAAFMGRRSVALQLMQSGIELRRKNLKGFTPADLCSDGWLREAITSCGVHREYHGGSRGTPAKAVPWDYGKEQDIAEDIQVSARLRFEPFFVPRAPVVKDIARSSALQQLGIRIFNQRSGQGLAFLVATASVKDFPIELSTFLLENKVNPVQVGEFLGEDFSLSQTLRLEFINSVRLANTGVVSCLAKVFKQLHIPSDMQKIDRLLEGVAQIWWRQHERLQDYPHHLAGEGDADEMEGLRLMRHVANYGQLHQLMFSTILLHWSLYAPLPPSQRVTLAQWLEMNMGLGSADGIDLSAVQYMQRLIYDTISRTFIPQLQIWSKETPSAILPLGGPLSGGSVPVKPGDSAAVPPTSAVWSEKQPAMPESHAVEEQQVVEGWVRLAGGGFPSAAGAFGTTVTYRHVRSIHSEATSSAAWNTATPVNSRPGHDLSSTPTTGSSAAGVPVNTLPAASRPGEATDGKATGGAAFGAGPDRVWLSLYHCLLLFAPKPQNWSPYAFMHLGQIVIRSVDPKSLLLTLGAAASPSQEASTTGLKAERSGDIDEAAKTAASDAKPAAAGAGDGTQVQLVFLLPDGRWQVLEIPCLQVQFADATQLEHWVMALGSICQGNAGTPKVKAPVPSKPSRVPSKVSVGSKASSKK